MSSEKITAKIYDGKLKWIEDLKGTLEANLFTYKEHSLFGLGGQEKRLQVDETKIFDYDKKTRVLLYKRVDNNYYQIQITDILDIKALIASGTVINFSDLLNQIHIADLEKDKIIKPPFNIKDLVQFLMYLVAIVLMILVYFTVQQAKQGSADLYAPVSKSQNQTEQVLLYAINLSKVGFNESKACIVAFNQYNLQRSGLQATTTIPLGG